MAEIRVNPTRMELKKLKTRMLTAKRGHKLLKDKCDELMKQFLDLIHENKVLRLRVEDKLEKSHKSFRIAAAVSSQKMLEESLMLPKREGELKVSYENRMSVIVPKFDFEIRGPESGDSYNYGFAFTSGELDSALADLTAALPDLIRLAEVEKAAQLLADEIEKTRRRVNALEYIMIPQLQSAIKSITMKLDENERGNTTRLMKVKDMMLEKAISEKRSAE